MPGVFEIYIDDPFGVRLTPALTGAAGSSDPMSFLSLDYTRIVNEATPLTLVLPGTFDYSLLRKDGRIEVWRSVNNGLPYLETECTWLIRAIERDLTLGGERLIQVTASCPNDLIDGRIVAYNDGSSQAAQTTFADDMLKTIVSQNLGSAATDTLRDLSAYLSIQANFSAAPSITKRFAWRKMKDVFKEIVDASYQLGTPLYFDIVAPTPATLEFRTYTQQRGSDHRSTAANPVSVGPDYGNLTDTRRIIDWTQEATFAYALASGIGSAKIVQSDFDQTRLNESPFSRREVAVTATNYTDSTSLTKEATAAVRAGIPKRSFTGRMVETPDTLYGVHWFWGDRVTATADGETFDARINAIKVSVAQGVETIETWLQVDA